MTVSSETLSSSTTPEQLDSRLGTLEFVHALNVYLDGFAGASTYAVRKGEQGRRPGDR